MCIRDRLFALIQGSALTWAFFMGMITDRIDRLLAIALGLGIAGAGYLLMSSIGDPFGTQMYPAAVLLGMGETSVIVTAGALLGQEARPEYRGSIVGCYGLLGGLGILTTTLGGGQLFDLVGRTAPFAMMGILNLLLLVAAVGVYLKYRGPDPVTAATPEIDG